MQTKMALAVTIRRGPEIIFSLRGSNEANDLRVVPRGHAASIDAVRRTSAQACLRPDTDVGSKRLNPIRVNLASTSQWNYCVMKSEDTCRTKP